MKMNQKLAEIIDLQLFSSLNQDGVKKKGTSWDRLRTELILIVTTTWKCHVDECSENQYEMIIIGDILMTPGIEIKLYQNIKECSIGMYQDCTSAMVDLKDYASEPNM